MVEIPSVGVLPLGSLGLESLPVVIEHESRRHPVVVVEGPHRQIDRGPDGA